MRNPATASTQWSDAQLHLLVLLAVTTAAWAPALGGAFHYDDLANIVLDRSTSQWDVLLTRLSNGFRPLLRLSYAADHALWGFTPAGFLATNLAVHLLTVLAVWRLASHRLTTPLAALFAALVFALQPAHASAVAWASGRSTGLSTLLLCLALLAHERGIGARGLRWPTVAVVLMALAAAVKEVALIFPALVVLWEATRGEQPTIGTLLRRIAPTMVAAFIMLAVMLAASSHLRGLVGFSFAYAPPFEALADQLCALPVSLSLWFRPWALAIEHSDPEGTAALALGTAMVTAMIAAGVWNLRRRPLLALALLWPLAMLLPSHSLIARVDLVVEKPLYGAWIGPSLAFGALVAAGVQASRALPLRAVTALMLVALVATAHWRAWVWSNPAALWREASEAAPLSARAWRSRAVTAMGARDIADARFALEHARTLAPAEPRLEDIELTLNLIAPSTEEGLPR